MIARWLNKLLGKSSSTSIDPLGDRGENVAAKELRNKGYRIIQRNFECKYGEVDIIARHGRSLVFVEVKTRKDSDPEPEEQVNLDKQRQVAKVAEYYMTRFGTPPPPVRFDVISIIWPRNQNPIIRHIEDAFASPLEGNV
ncbi:MAG: YraN family protein [Tepidisphaeraceae bacterium]